MDANNLYQTQAIEKDTHIEYNKQIILKGNKKKKKIMYISSQNV